MEMAAGLPDFKPLPEIKLPLDTSLSGRSALLVETVQECPQVMQVTAGESFHFSHSRSSFFIITFLYMVGEMLLRELLGAQQQSAEDYCLGVFERIPIRCLPVGP